MHLISIVNMKQFSPSHRSIKWVALFICQNELTPFAEHLLLPRLGGRVDPGPSLEFRHELEALHGRRCAHHGDDGRDQRNSMG